MEGKGREIFTGSVTTDSNTHYYVAIVVVDYNAYTDFGSLVLHIHRLSLCSLMVLIAQ